MPEYTLYYFPARGRAEIARLLFAAAGQKYEDKRIAGEEWQKVKESMPTRQMPVLEMDGKLKIAQSLTIARYLAKEFGLAGKGNLGQALVDQVVDTCSDMLAEFVKIHFEKDEERKKTMQEKMTNETTPNCFQTLKKLMELHGKNGYFVGDELTLADLMVYDVFTGVVDRYPTFFDPAPELAKHRKLVESNENVKKHIDSRPKTEF